MEQMDGLQQPRMEKRTDLALEVRESFPEDQVEIPGVSLQEEYFQRKQLRMTTVKICNEEGSRQMGKPIGTYITMEFLKRRDGQTKEQQKRLEDRAAAKLAEVLEDMVSGLEQKRREEIQGEGQGEEEWQQKTSTILLAGLGNRFATPDALGPFVLEKVPVNRHIVEEFGREALGKEGRILCALAPGVMGQTGMETREILGGIIEKVKPVSLLVVDALASRSVNRLCTTIQITDTGISPGAGIGNNRNALNQDTLAVPVIAIGVPTVVDAGTIVTECMEESLGAQGYQEEEIRLFLQSLQPTENLFVTPKDIDEQIRNIGEIVAKGIRIFGKVS